jgi:hypothetical protein
MLTSGRISKLASSKVSGDWDIGPCKFRKILFFGEGFKSAIEEQLLAENRRAV